MVTHLTGAILREIQPPAAPDASGSHPRCNRQPQEITQWPRIRSRSQPPAQAIPRQPNGVSFGGVACDQNRVFRENDVVRGAPRLWKPSQYMMSCRFWTRTVNATCCLNTRVR